MIEHTKGPWAVKTETKQRFSRLTGEPEAPRVLHWVTTQNGEHIALTFTGSEMMEGNAHLMAAAPDMVEAFRSAELALSEYCDRQASRDDPAWDALGDVRAAIVKAEGRI